MRRPLLLVFAVCAAWAMATPAQGHPATSYYTKGKWATPKTVAYGFTPSVPSDFRARTKNAANQWNKLEQTMKFGTPTSYTSNYDGRTNCSKSGVHVTREAAGGVLGWAYTCYVNGKITQFNLIYDGAENWYTGTGTPGTKQPDLWSVGAHELGHATGFYEHFSNSSAECPVSSSRHTMCASHYVGTTWQRSLANHDKHTFTSAY